MGGCGGKKAREKAKAAKVASTIGGKFDSTGTATDQQANLALVTRLLGEIGPVRVGFEGITIEDGYFIADCRIKLNQMGSAAVFGWRQVAKAVEVHKKVLEARGMGGGNGKTEDA